MKHLAPGAFGTELKALRETAGFTQEELATVAGLSVHAISALERGERRRPHVDTVRALADALELAGAAREAFLRRARGAAGGHHQPAGVLLPRPLTTLVGRDTDMAVLRRWLDDPASRLITMIGSGGVGKTRLALELAHALAEGGASRIIFMPLATIRDSVFVASAIAEAFGLVDVVASELPRRVRVACQDTPTLVILDNVEHVLDAVPLVADLLTTVPSLRVLATSRASLRVRGEREYVVGPLALSGGAVRLFVERAQDVRPDFRLTSANSHLVTAICQRLDALPLAIELAARWMKVLTLEELLRRLDTDVLFSVAGPRDLPERQQTMNATVAWSYQLLDPHEQRAFRRVGAIPGPFSIAAVAEVLAGDVDDALRAASGLIDKSLLLRSEPATTASGPRYHMLETVRAYAALELDGAGERDEATDGLVRYCRHEASLAEAELFGPAQVEWLERVQADVENYRHVLASLLARGDAAATIAAAGFAWSLLPFWVIREQAEGIRWYDQVLQASLLPPLEQSRALIGLATLCFFNRGDLQRARGALEQARPLAGVAHGDVEIARIDDMTARIEHAAGNLEAAHALFARAIDAFETLAIPWALGNAHMGLARVTLATGDLAATERLLDDATTTLQRTGPWFLSRVLYVRALLAMRRGEVDRAIAWLDESLGHNRQLGDTHVLVYTLVPLARAALLIGDPEWAARLLGARDAIAERTGATIALKMISDLHEQTERDVRARLGPDRWDRAWQAGREASLDFLLDDVLTPTALTADPLLQ